MTTRSVGKTPEKILAWTNKVYCHPSDRLLGNRRNAFIKSGEFYFMIEAHRGMTEGYLGINSVQRATIGASAGVPMNAEPFQPKDIEANSMKIELTRLDAKRSDFKIDSGKLQQVMLKVFNKQVFGIGQMFVADFMGLPLKCKVTEMSAPDFSKADDASLVAMAYVAQLAPHTILSFTSPNRDIKIESSEKKNMFLDPNWKFADMGIGGLDTEFSTIFRRAFQSRLLPKHVVARLGVTHTRGMLLYGPPGCGKTLIARQIGKMLRAKEPKVVNGPDILSKYVGESEKNIRALFGDAEKEQKMKGDDSDLHIIILDELDAICKKRGSVNSGSGVHDTVVNQLLSKIDGVDSLHNILLIGMTNRKDMIDEALLRPGRLEVHVEIGLPDEDGRHQILKIHTKKLKLSRALDNDVDLDKLAEMAKNFSGAELKGLVTNATTFATNRCVQYSKEGGIKMLDPEKIHISMEDFTQALHECKKSQSLGVEEDDLKNDISGGLIDYGDGYKKIKQTMQDLVRQVKESKATPLLSVLLCGPKGTGKTAIAANLALESDFPFVKRISPVKFVGMSEMQKTQAIASIFDSAYKTPLSVIILDDLERLLEYVPVGPRFSNHILQALMVLINRIPPKPARVLIVATCSSARVLRDLNLADVFNVRVQVPELSKAQEVEKVLTNEDLGLKISTGEMKKIAESCPLPISIKQLLLVLEMTRVACKGAITAEEFTRRVEATGVAGGVKSSRAALESFLETMEDL